MQKEVTKLSFNEMTQEKMYDLFELRNVRKHEALTTWLSELPELNEEEKMVAKIYQKRLIDNIDVWNDQELLINFIGPIFGSINFTVFYKLNWFAQRPLSGIIGEYELVGKPDGTIASGYYAPKVPYFSFHEYKKDINSNGDPAGQNLAAMLAGQQQNDNEEVIYGCYVVGRFWYFMVLKGKEYAISKDYSTTDEEIFEIVKILKALRNILFKRLGIEL